MLTEVLIQKSFTYIKLSNCLDIQIIQLCDSCYGNVVEDDVQEGLLLSNEKHVDYLAYDSGYELIKSRDKCNKEHATFKLLWLILKEFHPLPRIHNISICGYMEEVATQESHNQHRRIRFDVFLGIFMELSVIKHD